MYSSFRSNYQKPDKNKEERKRLKVFSNLSSVPPLSKKIDQRVITKEISKDNYRDSETRFRPEFGSHESEQEVKTHQKYSYQDSKVYQQDPIQRVRNENLVGQSLPSFDTELGPTTQLSSKEKTSDVLNKSFNDVNMGASSFLTPSAHDASVEFGLNRSQNTNVFEQRTRTQGSTNFHSLPKRNLGIKSLKDNPRRGRREFFPSNRWKRGGMTFGQKSGKKKSSEGKRASEGQKTAQWGLKVDKIKTSVGNIRNPDFLKNPS